MYKRDRHLAKAAARAGMSENTARKYLRAGSEARRQQAERDWRTREDPFAADWSEVSDMLELNQGLESKTLFEYLQRIKPGEYGDGQLRTLQRRIKQWRALEGPAKEVYFPQRHEPGRVGASDFVDMSDLGIVIAGEPYQHLLYHFVLTYSNWETGMTCASESFESVSTGLQNALWELGGVPERHRTDRMTAAVHTLGSRAEYTEAYAGLLRHYRIVPEATQSGKAHENGDIEQRHYRFKRALDQALMLRGSRAFDRRASYEQFLREIFKQVNQGRQDHLKEELALLRPLPLKRLEDRKQLRVRVSKASTLQVQNNTYSVHSRLIGEQVEVRVYMDHLEVWYAQQCIQRMARLRGRKQHRINYRHIIDWLVRKPGAFSHYRYRNDLFPTSVYRIAYDMLYDHLGRRADKEYLKILHLAARESESGVETALWQLMEAHHPLTAEAVKASLDQAGQPTEVLGPEVGPVNLNVYDELLSQEVR